jgi:subtilisin family serine protease
VITSGTVLEVATKERPQIGYQARQQIEALMAEKAARTWPQRKISSRLLYTRKMRRGKAIANGVQKLRTGVQVEADGTTLVDVRGEVTESVLAQMEALGATIVNNFPEYQAVRARIPIDQVEALALLPQVAFVRPADEMMTHSHDPNADNVSEGDVTHRAAQARTTFGVDGTGITIGVISDGVNSLAARQATGDLPANVTVLPGQAGLGDEGTAMLEIVHDLAPGASLLFATALPSEAQLAANIQALRNAGADVIVDDVRYFAEPVFQDGIVAQAVNTVAADGAVYFSSAGNSGNLNDGTSGVWEGDFSPMAGPPVLGSVTAHDFGGGTNSNQITQDSPNFFILTWSDPQGGSSNDYDLFLLSPDLSTVFDSSTNTQSGTQDPFESISSRSFNDVNNRLVVVRSSGADRFLHLNTTRGRLSIGTDGQTSGHNSAEGAFGVAAVNVATAAGGPFTGGAANPVETFSSDGPRRIFFEADGTPITAGIFSANGGTVRQKPDIAAADGVSTATPGFNPFFGTSAAAPHAAAIAALVRAANPTLTPAQVRTALTSTAVDIEAAGVDRESGSGILDTFAAVGAVAVPVISVTPDSLDFGLVLVGSSADLTFTVKNTGGGTLIGDATTSPPYTIVSGGSYNLTAGQTQTVTVRFMPTSGGAFTGSVDFTGGDGASRTVTGTGVGVNTITPGTVDLFTPPPEFTITGGGFADVGQGFPVINFVQDGVVVGQERATALTSGTSITVPFPWCRS